MLNNNFRTIIAIFFQAIVDAHLPLYVYSAYV
jgi:hypothetical protein